MGTYLHLSAFADMSSPSLLPFRSLIELGRKLQMAAAAKLYEMGELSSGAAAQLAGIPRTVFLSRLADYGIDTFRLSEDELQREVRLA